MRIKWRAVVPAYLVWSFVSFLAIRFLKGGEAPLWWESVLMGSAFAFFCLWLGWIEVDKD